MHVLRLSDEPKAHRKKETERRKKMREWNRELFEAWKKMVESTVVRITGMSTDDLPDYPYADWFQEGVKPSVAAEWAIRAAGGGDLV